MIRDDLPDHKILLCPPATGTQSIVTGDKKHLLPLGSFRGVSIVGLRDFLASYSGD